MTVREHLVQEVADYLPEMVRENIQKANIDYRRQYLERITQLSSVESNPEIELQTDSEPNPDLR